MFDEDAWLKSIEDIKVAFDNDVQQIRADFKRINISIWKQQIMWLFSRR